jgi:hypothetical protein
VVAHFNRSQRYSPRMFLISSSSYRRSSPTEREIFIYFAALDMYHVMTRAKKKQRGRRKKTRFKEENSSKPTHLRSGFTEEMELTSG